MGGRCLLTAAVVLAVSWAVAESATDPPMIPYYPEGDNFYFDLKPSDPLYSIMTAEDARLTPEIPQPVRRSPEGKATTRSTCPEQEWPVMCGSYSLSDGQCITFASPNFPSAYTSNFNCAWTFTAAEAGQELEMTCSDFTLAKKKDALTVNKDGTVQTYKRNVGPPSPTVTSGGALKAAFKSDRKKNAKGFKCVVRNAGSDSSTTPKPDENDIPLSHPECGRGLTRIINGEETAVHEYKWQVWLLTAWENNKAASCGGSIINEKWVMTAAHCLSSDAEVRSIRVAVGAHQKENPTLHGGYNVFAETYIIHENYNFPSNDIAVIKLKEGLTFNEIVGPACLAPRSWVSDDFVGDVVTISGWGATEDGSSSDFLRDVQTTGISFEDCKGVYQGLPEMVMCTASTNVKKACYGDSGGPVTTPKNGRHFQVGLVSFGATCSGDVPDGHCRVASMIDWLETNTGLSFGI